MLKRGAIVCSGKKADVSHHLILVVFELLLVIAVSAFFFEAIASIRENTVFERSFFAKDLALLTETLYTSPGNVFYEYSNEKAGLNKFSYTFFDKAVSVKEGEGYTDIYYGIAESVRYPKLDFALTNPSLIQFLQDADTITIGSDLKPVFRRLRCPDIDTSDPGWKTKPILLVPGYGGVNQQDSGFTEFGVTDSIVKNLMRREYGLNAESLSPFDEEKPVPIAILREKIKSKPDAVVIVLKVADYEELGNSDVVGYISVKSSNNLHSRKLACLVLNQLSLDFTSITGSRIVLVNPDNYGSESLFRLLGEDNVGVVIELGNIQIPRTESFLYHTQKISTMIYSGLEDYYEH